MRGTPGLISPFYVPSLYNDRNGPRLLAWDRYDLRDFSFLDPSVPCRATRLRRQVRLNAWAIFWKSSCRKSRFHRGFFFSNRRGRFERRFLISRCLTRAFTRDPQLLLLLTTFDVISLGFLFLLIRERSVFASAFRAHASSEQPSTETRTIARRSSFQSLGRSSLASQSPIFISLSLFVASFLLKYVVQLPPSVTEFTARSPSQFRFVQSPAR